MPYFRPALNFLHFLTVEKKLIFNLESQRRKQEKVITVIVRLEALKVDVLNAYREVLFYFFYKGGKLFHLLDIVDENVAKCSYPSHFLYLNFELNFRF